MVTTYPCLSKYFFTRPSSLVSPFSGSPTTRRIFLPLACAGVRICCALAMKQEVSAAPSNMEAIIVRLNMEVTTSICLIQHSWLVAGYKNNRGSRIHRGDEEMMGFVVIGD